MVQDPLSLPHWFHPHDLGQKGALSYVTRVSGCCFLHESFCFFQWRQADSIRHLGKVTLAQEQDYTGLVVGCVCVSLLLLLLGTLLLWKKNKHIDGESRATDSLMLYLE